MKFELRNPILLGINQLDNIPLFRDGHTETRSYDVDQRWNRTQIVSATGSFERHHLYFIVSRGRARFAPLKGYPGNHFLLNREKRLSPAEINFSDPDSSVYEAILDLTEDHLTDVLMHGVKHRLSINDVIHIAAEPAGQQFVTAASFIFKEENINVACSPDLWRFIRFPGKLEGKGPETPLPFDYRIEYIGKSINFAEERLFAHEHVRRVQTALSSQEPDREAFVVLYQVDYQAANGRIGVGGRANHLELKAAEAVLIQYFKPQFNTLSIDFSLDKENKHPADEGLARAMLASDDFAIGSTTLSLESPATSSAGNLLWGRYFTAHCQRTLCVYEIIF
jgi:hypothetical protein